MTGGFRFHETSSPLLSLISNVIRISDCAGRFDQPEYGHQCFSVAGHVDWQSVEGGVEPRNRRGNSGIFATVQEVSLQQGSLNLSPVSH